MELKELPEKLAVIGGGYVGLEFASMYASFGSQVTVLEGHADLIPREDRDCLLYTSPSPRDRTRSRMPSSA